jgi:perosamine synthetase
MDFFNTHISPKAIELATQVLKSGWISEGKMVKEFEIQLNKRLGLANPVALNSGTSALHLALVLAGVGPGDEVIIPAQTFVATGLVVLMQRANPVFADIDPTTGNISVASIKEKITDRTKAIIPVHWGGYPCDLDEINELATQHNLIVIEDAAHALGATYKGKPVGSISRFSAFSFQAIKHLTTGDGGALACMDAVDSKNAFVRRWFGIDRTNSKPSILGERIYDITELGFKYHMNDLAAVVGLGNIENFSEWLSRRREIAVLYRKEFANVAGLQLMNWKKDRESASWLFTILVENREDFIRKLSEREISASVVHLRIDQNSVFGGIKNLPNQKWFNERQVSIPVHESLRDCDIELIVKSIKEGW